MVLYLGSFQFNWVLFEKLNHRQSSFTENQMKIQIPNKQAILIAYNMNGMIRIHIVY